MSPLEIRCMAERLVREKAEKAARIEAIRVKCEQKTAADKAARKRREEIYGPMPRKPPREKKETKAVTNQRMRAAHSSARIIFNKHKLLLLTDHTPGWEADMEKAASDLKLQVKTHDLLMAARKIINKVARKTKHKNKKQKVRKKRVRRERKKEEDRHSEYAITYLREPLWLETIRPRILDRDDHRCRVCNSIDHIQVHHRSYDNDVMRGENDEKLITLCRKHHIEIEFSEYYGDGDERNKKRNRRDVELKLQELLNGNRRS